MANPEHLEILKHGVNAWNAWWEEHATPYLRPDLSGANLNLVNLRDANFYGAILDNVDFRSANLSGACLEAARLNYANLGAAILADADLSHAYLAKANLAAAYLYRTNFLATNLKGVNIYRAILHGAKFIEVDLSEIESLDSVLHNGPSSIGIDTIYKSRGNIPEKFLRGCGVPKDFIIYMRSLVGKAIEFYSCFISYSSKDEEFAKRLYNDLQSEGVRCWFAPEDLKIGDKFRVRIDESIRLYDKLLLVLSENSVASQWVEKEVETAFEKEDTQKKPVLFPVRLDDAVMEEMTGWAADIRRTRHIGDFSDWKNHDSYKKAFERLMRDLKAGEKR